MDFFSMPDCPNGTTKRLPRGRDCVGGVLARAAGARLRELPSAAAMLPDPSTPIGTPEKIQAYNI